MKIDGRCHCGYITYEAEIDPRQDSDLPLHRLPNAVGLRVSRGRVHSGKCVQVAFGRTENLRQDQRKREQTTTIVLPGMWNANLCDGGGRRTQGLLHSTGLSSSTRPDRSEGARLVSLRAAMDRSHWIDAKDRKAAADRPDRQGKPHLVFARRDVCSWPSDRSRCQLSCRRSGDERTRCAQLELCR